jgi:hypothetical protein
MRDDLVASPVVTTSPHFVSLQLAIKSERSSNALFEVVESHGLLVLHFELLLLLDRFLVLFVLVWPPGVV